MLLVQTQHEQQFQLLQGIWASKLQLNQLQFAVYRCSSTSITMMLITSPGDLQAQYGQTPRGFDVERAVNLLCDATENLSTIQQQLLSEVDRAPEHSSNSPTPGHDRHDKNQRPVGDKTEPNAVIAGSPTEALRCDIAASNEPIAILKRPDLSHPRGLTNPGTGESSLQASPTTPLARCSETTESVAWDAAKSYTKNHCRLCGAETTREEGPFNAIKKCFMKICGACGPEHRWRKVSFPSDFRCYHGIRPTNHKLKTVSQASIPTVVIDLVSEEEMDDRTHIVGAYITLTFILLL